MSVDVLLSSGSFWPREGGAERQMRQVLQACRQDGTSCAVVTQVVPGQPRRARVDGLEVHRVGSLLLFRRAPRLGQLFWMLMQSWTVLRLRPRTAISIQLGAASTAVALARWSRPVAHVIRLTGGGTPQFRSEPWARRASRVGRLVVRLLVRQQVLLVSPAKHLLEDFAAAFPQHRVATRVVPNGVADIDPDRLPADGRRSGVVWYARGGAVKSTDAFLRLVGACPGLVFSAFGRTDDLPEGGPVRRLGWLPDPVDTLGGARVLLNTSPTEGMPNTALQALAVGLRVVGPANEGLLELADLYPDRVTLVDLDDPAAAARVLREVHDAALPGPAPVPGATTVVDLWRQIFTEEAGRCPV